MKKLLPILCLLCIIGCSAKEEEPDRNEPLPPDEILSKKVYKDIKNINCFLDEARAVIINDDKTLTKLHTWHYSIVLDATEEPWWEATEVKFYCWKYFEISKRGWVRCSSHKTVVIIHLTKLEDATHHMQRSK